MKVRIKNKVLLAILVGILTCEFSATTVYAEEISCEKEVTDVTYEEMVDVLVKNGYTKGTAEALGEDQIVDVYEGIIDGTVVGIQTCAMEIDNLAEVEAFYSYSEEELFDLGMTESEIEMTKKNFDKMNAMSDDKLKKEYGLSKVECKLFRRAIDNGKENRKNNQKYGKKLKNSVSASGNLLASEMSYTQLVKNFTVDTEPAYLVLLSYSWNNVYLIGCFNDRIVAAWGGGLNSRSESGSASYYDNNLLTLEFGDYCTMKDMEMEFTPNTGIEFIFPQVYGMSYDGDNCKTKQGLAHFILYQTQMQGYDTKVVSNYCHRIISVLNADISFGNGIAPSISISDAWRKSPQGENIIRY